MRTCITQCFVPKLVPPDTPLTIYSSIVTFIGIPMASISKIQKIFFHTHCPCIHLGREEIDYTWMEKKIIIDNDLFVWKEAGDIGEKSVKKIMIDWNIGIEDNSFLNVINLLWQHQSNYAHKWGFDAFHPATPFHDHMMVEAPQLASPRSSVTSMILHLFHLLHKINETANSTD